MTQFIRWVLSKQQACFTEGKCVTSTSLNSELSLVSTVLVLIHIKKWTSSPHLLCARGFLCALIIHLCSFLWSTSLGDCRAHRCLPFRARLSYLVQCDVLQDVHAQCMETGSFHAYNVCIWLWKARIERTIWSQVPMWYLCMFTQTQEYWTTMMETNLKALKGFFNSVFTMIQFKQILLHWKQQLLMFRIWLWRGRKGFYKSCITINIVIESLCFISVVVNNSMTYVNPFPDVDPYAQKYSC